MSSEMNGMNGLATPQRTQTSGTSGSKVTGVGLRRMLERQDYCCALSGIQLEPSTAEADHITPIANGGTNTIDNIQILHSVVNRMKGTLDQDEFIEWCQRIADNG